ncbi:hypothetical protein PUNSTDRAFT_120887 [Punctularia strigosozonata HHB-11173 SS5]|uniref:uncharacterized protein n=1 Tax=Punctularia strigosozonata (strain HHB-11173) TaxID=741275 RepID=UPI0004418637|nr:uncharacterized protein PUNSTDRAFT_120887 [Punctularia strigosozonata HHB-11173 SS5]EIN08635.1 hypothetical protein PUNSTDRAFT_120887 [Punctularia strigosozonata HHB-11173 SS5]
MPAEKRNEGGDRDRERDQDRDRDRDRDRSKPKGPGKAKDLSHVPCKFFKVGSCTAGAACPFSHAALEPGQAKDVCTWFVKGNCKFGHKCALAHVLPGQSMAMDRKNKKAAQIAHASGGGKEGGGGGRERDRDRGDRDRERERDRERGDRDRDRDREGSRGGRAGRGTNHGHSTASGGGPASSGGAGSSSSKTAANPLLAGLSVTAPTRASRGTAATPLQATIISPAAPAPAITDADFASMSLLDDASASAQAPTRSLDQQPQQEQKQSEQPAATSSDASSPASGPVDVPRATQRANELGPIGSPPRGLTVTGVSPPPNSTPGSAGFPASPPAPPLSTSPFSAPGAQTAFRDVDFRARSGMAASLGARTWMASSSSHPTLGNEEAVEDADLEEFIPGSLSDLLTPEERQRRLSRNANAAARPKPSMLAAPQLRPAPSHHADSGAGGHRYSRSVPGASLLSDIKSIWARPDGMAPGSPGAMGGAGGVVGASPGASPGLALGNGTPSSFTSRSPPATSVPMLSPTNASAAFLPGLHAHYAQAYGQRPGLVGASASFSLGQAGDAANVNGGSVAAFSPPRAANGFVRPPLSAAPSDPTFLRASALAHPQSQSQTLSQTLAAQHLQQQQYPHAGVPALGNTADLDYGAGGGAGALLSPSARALQAHAPGQSLPQGLAAGYSRIHARPPAFGVGSPSPAAGVAFSPGSKTGGGIGYAEWASSGGGVGVGGGGAENGLGLESMFSRLSSFSAASKAGARSVSGGAQAQAGRGYGAQAQAQTQTQTQVQGGTPLSPLSKPAFTGDDDDVLFSFDH